MKRLSVDSTASGPPATGGAETSQREWPTLLKRVDSLATSTVSSPGERRPGGRPHPLRASQSLLRLLRVRPHPPAQVPIQNDGGEDCEAASMTAMAAAAAAATARPRKKTRRLHAKSQGDVLRLRFGNASVCCGHGDDSPPHRLPASSMAAAVMSAKSGQENPFFAVPLSTAAPLAKGRAADGLAPSSGAEGVGNSPRQRVAVRLCCSALRSSSAKAGKKKVAKSATAEKGGPPARQKPRKKPTSDVEDSNLAYIQFLAQQEYGILGTPPVTTRLTPAELFRCESAVGTANRSDATQPASVPDFPPRYLMNDWEIGGTQNPWVCPSDRHLQLRAQLKSGWSVRTATARSPTNAHQRSSAGGGANGVSCASAAANGAASGSPALSAAAAASGSAITDDEQEQIRRVLARAEHGRVKEELRIGKMVDRLEKLRSRATGNGVTQCLLCQTEFGLLAPKSYAAMCLNCRKYVCQRNCGVETFDQKRGEPIFLCKICSEYREVMWKKSGAWFYREMPNYQRPSAIGPAADGNFSDGVLHAASSSAVAAAAVSGPNGAASPPAVAASRHRGRRQSPMASGIGADAGCGTVSSCGASPAESPRRFQHSYPSAGRSAFFYAGSDGSGGARHSNDSGRSMAGAAVGADDDAPPAAYFPFYNPPAGSNSRTGRDVLLQRQLSQELQQRLRMRPRPRITPSWVHEKVQSSISVGSDCEDEDDEEDEDEEDEPEEELEEPTASSSSALKLQSQSRTTSLSAQPPAEVRVTHHAPGASKPAHPHSQRHAGASVGGASPFHPLNFSAQRYHSNDNNEESDKDESRRTTPSTSPRHSIATPSSYGGDDICASQTTLPTGERAASSGGASTSGGCGAPLAGADTKSIDSGVVQSDHSAAAAQLGGDSAPTGATTSNSLIANNYYNNKQRQQQQQQKQQLPPPIPPRVGGVAPPAVASGGDSRRGSAKTSVTVKPGAYSVESRVSSRESMQSSDQRQAGSFFGGLIRPASSRPESVSSDLLAPSISGECLDEAPAAVGSGSSSRMRTSVTSVGHVADNAICSSADESEQPSFVESANATNGQADADEIILPNVNGYIPYAVYGASPTGYGAYSQRNKTKVKKTLSWQYPSADETPDPGPGREGDSYQRQARNTISVMDGSQLAAASAANSQNFRITGITENPSPVRKSSQIRVKTPSVSMAPPQSQLQALLEKYQSEPPPITSKSVSLKPFISGGQLKPGWPGALTNSLLLSTPAHMSSTMRRSPSPQPLPSASTSPRWSPMPLATGSHCISICVDAEDAAPAPRRHATFVRPELSVESDDGEIHRLDVDNDEVEDDILLLGSSLSTPRLLVSSASTHSIRPLGDRVGSFDEDDNDKYYDNGAVYSEDMPVGQHRYDETLGFIQFNVTYLPEEQQLIVHLIRAKGLKAMDKNGFSDPYVKLHLIPGNAKATKLTSRTIEKTLNPEWHEELIYHGVTEDDRQRKFLRVTVLDRDRIGSDFLGETRVALKKLPPGATKKFSLYLEHVMPTPVQKSEEEPERGKILVSVCYNIQQGSLFVNIKRCAELLGMDSTGFSDPYCKVSLTPLASKTHRQKTAIKKRTLNPEFNTQLQFIVPFKDLPKKTLEIGVYDYDVGRHDDYIGGILLSTTAKDLRGKQWRDCIQNPGKTFEYWHKLELDN